MPNRWFITTFDPFRGDIMYGTTGSRADYLESWMENWRGKPRVEHLHGVSFSVYGTRNYYINDYNESITKADLSYPSEAELQIQDGKQRNYFGLLNQTKYRFKSWEDDSIGDLVGALKKNDTTITINSRMSREDWASRLMVLAVRRSCKFGIEYIAALKNNYVHYILDEIDMDEVVNKTERPLWVGTTGVPITTSELRFLFRYWKKFKDLDRVIFYKDLNEVDPPWVKEPDRWLPYAQHRLQKYPPPGIMDRGYKYNFEQAVIANNAREALKWFHKMEIWENSYGR